MSEAAQVRKLMKKRADAHADAGYLVSMADARWLVLEICREAEIDRPPPDSLEYLASELVRLTLEAYEGSTARLRLRRAQ